MGYQTRTSLQKAGGTVHEVYSLMGPNGVDRAEIWPSFGGNCLRWSVAGGHGPLELLYAAPDWLENPIPTRSGIPVLFPFPNRIRAGRFTWHGQEYQLPLNCPQHRHAIHGFACRHPWRVLDLGADPAQAWLTMAFEPRLDAPAVVPWWPGAYRLELHIALASNQLVLRATVVNVGTTLLPWGLGYHPYFRLFRERPLVQLQAESIWELQECLPTGKLQHVGGSRDLNEPRLIADLQCDDLYTGIRKRVIAEGAQSTRCGQILYTANENLTIEGSHGFREVVVFVPPHRQAICLEPYTCATDAINLAGADVGLQILEPGKQAALDVFLRYRTS